MAQDCGEEPIGIGRIDSKRRNLLPIAKTEVRPSSARISRAIDAIANRQVRAMQTFSTRNVNHVAIGRCDSDGTDRGGLEKAV